MSRSPERSKYGRRELIGSRKARNLLAATLVLCSSVLPVACTVESKYGCEVEKVEEAMGIGGLIEVGDSVYVYGRGVQGPGPGDNNEFIGPSGGVGEVTDIVQRTIEEEAQIWMRVKFDCEKCDCDKVPVFGEADVSWNLAGTVKLTK